MTATLHALGCGRGAGAYYTEDSNREARPRSRDNYYTRDGNGTWWSSGSSLVRNGEAIDKETFRDLCGGFNPRTGKRLVRGAGERHRAGWDITFSTPKSFGILWAAGTAEQRAALEKIQQDAVDEALELLIAERLVEVRLGAGGHRREAPDDIVVAKFPHFTSREGDPACHVHSVLLNVGRAAGKYLTLEPKRTYEHQLVLGAAFRSSLAERLAEMGFSLREAGRDQFEIAGIPEAMIEAFSKRSQQLKPALDVMLLPLKRKSRHWQRAAIKRACRRTKIWKGAGNKNSRNLSSTHGRLLGRRAWHEIHDESQRLTTTLIRRRSREILLLRWQPLQCFALKMC